MLVFKFKDKVDGNFAFVMGISRAQARRYLHKKTGLDFEFIDCKKVEELKVPLIIRNDILPF